MRTEDWLAILAIYVGGVVCTYGGLVIAFADSRKPRPDLRQEARGRLIWLGLAAPVWPLVLVVAVIAAVVVPVRWGWREVKEQAWLLRGRR